MLGWSPQRKCERRSARDADAWVSRHSTSGIHPSWSRRPCAEGVVRWAHLAEQAGSPDDKVRGALQLAKQMADWEIGKFNRSVQLQHNGRHLDTVLVVCLPHTRGRNRRFGLVVAERPPSDPNRAQARCRRNREVGDATIPSSWASQTERFRTPGMPDCGR